MKFACFRIRTLMIAVVVVSFWLASAVLTTRAATADIGVWMLVYLIPLTLIVARPISFAQTLQVGRRSLAFASLAVALYGLLCFFINGVAGFVGGSFLGMLLALWIALLSVSLSSKGTDQAGRLDPSGTSITYEPLTDRTRKVMQLANQEAQRFNHERVGTEHVLLGLIKEGSGVAANVLKNLDVDLRKIRNEVEKIVQAGPDMVTMGKLPQTPRAKKVIEYAIEEARNLNHNYVGTEHLLLGLLREQEGVAAQVLMNLNLNLKLDEVREEVLNLLGCERGDSSRPSTLSSE